MTDTNREPAPTHATRLLDGHSAGALAVAAELLAAGELIVFPTDTVYGVGVAAFDAAAIERLYAVKRRDLDKGIPILLADTADLPRVSRDLPASAVTLIERYWPGPLTVIVPRRPALPAVIAPNDTIAVRIPDNDIARALIRAAGGALATSSANLSLRPPATNAPDALAALGGLVAAVVDGGPTPGAVASTIVDCTGPTMRILRHGPISAADLGLTGGGEGVS